LSQYFTDYSDFIISSFYHDQLLELKENFNDVKTGIIFEGCPIDIESVILKSKADYVSLGYESVTTNMLDKIKRLSIKILLWTIDNAYDIDNALKMRPNGIISNFPDRIPKGTSKVLAASKF